MYAGNLNSISQSLILTDLENCLGKIVHEANRRSVKQYIETIESSIIENKDDVFIALTMCASPHYEVDQETHHCKAICDMFTYRISHCKKTTNFQCELIISKFILETIYLNGVMSIHRQEKQAIQSMTPWVYDKALKNNLLYRYSEYEPKDKIVSAISSVEVRNVLNAFFHRRLRDCKDLFSDTDVPSMKIEPLVNSTFVGKENILNQMKLWLEDEHANSGFYKFIGITSAAVIDINEAKGCAQSVCMAEVFRFDKVLDERNHSVQYEMTHTIGYVNATYILESKGWKILTIEINKIVDLPRELYRYGRRYDRMTGAQNEWYDAPGIQVNNLSNEVYKIENVIHKWGYYCRCGKLLDFYQEYMKNAEVECNMYFKSQGEKSVVSNSESNIIHRLTEMDSRFTPLMYSYHTATTPLITFDKNGDTAVGIWYDRSGTNLLSESTSKDSIPYMALLTKYIHHFKKINGKWYLIDFFAEPLISFNDWNLNVLESKGFISDLNAIELPNPYTTE